MKIKDIIFYSLYIIFVMSLFYFIKDFYFIKEPIKKATVFFPNFLSTLFSLYLFFAIVAMKKISMWKIIFLFIILNIFGAYILGGLYIYFFETNQLSNFLFWNFLLNFLHLIIFIIILFLPLILKLNQK